jgi:biopolymer transport protein ExbB/TolQ
VKVGRAPVVALVVASVLLLGSVIFILVATSNRDDAADNRRQAAQELRDQRTATQDAQDQLTAARSARQATINSIGAIIDSVQPLADISAQGVDAARTTQNIGASDNPSIGDYNAAIQHGNALADQYNAATQAVRDKIQSISRDLAGQIA